MSARGGRQRGTTIVELMTVVAVIGLILTMLGLEFVSVVNSTLHSRANTDAESQARVIMSKVETHMRSSYWDYTDFSGLGASPEPVISPLPGASAGYILFYRSIPGQLGKSIPTCSNGAPCPQFETVLIEPNPTASDGELDEIITPEPGGTAEPVNILGTNVSAFTVTALDERYDINLTVTEPSGNCVFDASLGKNACSFTLNDVVYVGGTQ